MLQNLITIIGFALVGLVAIGFWNHIGSIHRSNKLKYEPKNQKNKTDS